jgi:Ceramidase
MNTKIANTLLCGIIFLSIVVMSFIAPIPQDPHYHQFSDQQTICGINHFWNVMSNLPFLLVGLYGLWRFKKINIDNIKSAYLFFCVGVILVCFGSGYYHFNPNNHTLVWDRLPMTIAFMALFSLLLHERVLSNPKTFTLIPLLLIGAASVFYWDWTETNGQGDLRFYALVQFLPIILIPLILWLYPQRYFRSSYLLWAFVFYFLAKLLEHFDAVIHQTLGQMSGHSLKHMSAAIAVFLILQAIPVRAIDLGKIKFDKIKNADH